MTNEELKSFVRKNPVSLVGGLVALLSAGAIFYRSDRLSECETELAEKSALSERFALNNKNAAQLQEQFDAVAAANKIIDSRLVRASQFAKNLQYFYKLESETGVKLTADPRISPPAAKKDAKAAFLALPCSLSVQGSLPQLLGFLRRLESGTHYCRILNVTLGAPGDRSGTLNLSLNLELLGLP